MRKTKWNLSRKKCDMLQTKKFSVLVLGRVIKLFLFFQPILRNYSTVIFWILDFSIAMHTFSHVLFLFGSSGLEFLTKTATVAATSLALRSILQNPGKTSVLVILPLVAALSNISCLRSTKKTWYFSNKKPAHDIKYWRM